LGLVVHLADASTLSARFQLNVPENTGPVESQKVENIRAAIQQINEVVYSSTNVPTRAEIVAGQTMRVIAMLIGPDPTQCGAKMTLPELKLAAEFGGAGLAELQFVAPRSAELRFACRANELIVEIRNPLDPNS
jgi:hypothetical protein